MQSVLSANVGVFIYFLVRKCSAQAMFTPPIQAPTFKEKTYAHVGFRPPFSKCLRLHSYARDYNSFSTKYKMHVHGKHYESYNRLNLNQSGTLFW